MGVRGLTSFLEREGHSKRVNVSDEISLWKKNNPNRLPIIVFDFIAMTHFGTDLKDNICGGRHLNILNNFDEMLANIKAAGARLVFFSDLNTQKNKSIEWMKRRDESFAFNIDLYNRVSSRQSLQSIALGIKETKNISSASYGLSLIAQKYGEFNYAIEQECDLEMARYATENDAFAVVTSDSDFFIFKGNWKFWMANSFEITAYDSNLLTVKEYDRDGITKSLGITPNQRPIYATLIGNEFAIEMLDQLFQFQRRLGLIQNKFKNVAQFVIRCTNWNEQLLTQDYERIVKEMFVGESEKWILILKQSANSYDLNYPKHESNDKLVKQLIRTPYYRDYLMMMSDGLGFTLSFYDMRGNVGDQSLPKLFIEWIKRKSGILRQHEKNTHTLVVFAKFSFYQNFTQSNEESIFPEFKVPALNQLYLRNAASKIKWKLLGFIMSLSDLVLVKIQSIPATFRLVCSTLYALLQGGFCTIDEADGILLTEFMVHTNCKSVERVCHPIFLVDSNVRAAHIYNNTVPQMRQNFAIAGLLSEISAVSHFDGVYFQHIMGKSATERAKLLAPCEKYRFYYDLE